MKKILLLIIAPFAFFSVLSGQITQEKADKIVLERMSTDTPPYTIFAKGELQTEGISIMTSTMGEIELDYACWVYYNRYNRWPDKNLVPSRYLIVKEDNGNLLEINAKNDVGPDDLTKWRIVNKLLGKTDTITLGYRHIYYDTERDFRLQLDSVTNDSRCPINANCDWEGNVEVHINLIYGENYERTFKLNLNPSFQTDTVISNICYKLLSVDPYPEVLNNIEQRDYIIKILATPTEDENTPFSAAEMTKSINNFSMDFFATAYEELSTNENIVLSPLSLNMALAMVWNGANYDTRKGIQQAMGMQNYPQEEVNGYFLNLRKELTTVDPEVKLALANSIWYDIGFPVKKDFIDVNKDYYDAEVKEIDFSVPDAPKQINKWCSDNTNGLIKNMINIIPEGTVMYLINALYFKGLWADSCGFDPERTHQAYFHKESGETILTDMMLQIREGINYHSDHRLEMVSLPYGNGAYSMIFILPNGNFNEMLLQLKENGYWQNCLSNLKPQIVQLYIPKFKVEYEPEPDLNEILKKLGMENAFTGSADFSGISDAGLFISQVRQKTYIEVDEKGTEAAAITTIGMTTGEGPSFPYFCANRPFLFVIQENTTGTALFMGKIGDPK